MSKNMKFSILLFIIFKNFYVKTSLIHENGSQTNIF